MELSYFLQKIQPLPPILPEIQDNVKWEEEYYFNAWIKKFPENQHQEIIEKLKYIRAYALNFPEFDGEDWVFSQNSMNYYEDRENRIEFTGLSEDEFDNFEIIQEAMGELGLSPIATFDFIVFLWNELLKWQRGQITELVTDRVKRAIKRIEENPQDKIELDLKVGGKHFKFSNESFIKSLFYSFLNNKLHTAYNPESIYPTKRETDYILIKTLLEYLPIKNKKEKKGAYSQAERNFSLSVLWLTGELNHKRRDDPYFFCTKENNATFDKLMRDFRGMSLPPINPLF